MIVLITDENLHIETLYKRVWDLQKRLLVH